MPFIRQDLYEKLVAAAPNGNAQPVSPPSGSSGMPGPTSGGSPPNLPRNWQEIGLGDLVVANQSPEDGWYEAIVVAVTDDMLTLRWRDYPKERQIVRHRLRLGLLFPKLKSTAETGKSAKPTAAAKPDKPGLAKPAADSQGGRRAGTTSMPDISYWPKTTVHGGHGGKPFRLRRPATSSSCAGVTNPAA